MFILLHFAYYEKKGKKKRQMIVIIKWAYEMTVVFITYINKWTILIAFIIFCIAIQTYLSERRIVNSNLISMSPSGKRIQWRREWLR